MAIPVIDLSRPEAEVARHINEACLAIGFFAVVNHGVDDALIGKTWRQAAAFFDLPVPEKMSARHADASHPYGYFPPGQEALALSRGVRTPPDLKESSNLAPPIHHADGTGRFGGVARIWPSRPLGFRDAWEAYYSAMVGLSDRLMALFALALDVDPAYFASRTDHHLSALRGLNYPALMSPPELTQLRAGAHSDYGTLTILLPGPGAGGLEVQTAEGTWIPVQPIDESFVINIGDMMQLWTNDRWLSTVHRVAVPPAGSDSTAPAERRQSIAFFHQPNWDAEIATLPSCVDEAHPQLYEGVTAGPWLQAKFDRASRGATS